MTQRTPKSQGSNRKYSAEFPLHTAANEGDLDKVKILIQQFVLPSHSRLSNLPMKREPEDLFLVEDLETLILMQYYDFPT
jgi:hypothetical protein